MGYVIRHAPRELGKMDVSHLTQTLESDMSGIAKIRDVARRLGFARIPAGELPLTIKMSAQGVVKILNPSDPSRPLWLQGASLLDAVPLPSMRTIFDTESFSSSGFYASAAGVAWSIVDDPDEFGGKCLKIDVPAGLNSARIVLPVKQRLGGGYPKSRPVVEMRVRIDDWSAMSAFLPTLAQSTATYPVGYYWPVMLPATSHYGIKAPHIDRWNGKYRTLRCTMWQSLVSGSGENPWNDSNPDFEVQSLALQITTTAATSIYINRVVCPIWSVAGIITQGDGAYAEFYDPVFKDFKSRGWPGVVSRHYQYDPGVSMTVDQMREVVAAGWDLVPHLCKMTRGAGATDLPVVASMYDTATTADDLRAMLQMFRAYYVDALGIGNAGFSSASQLRNQGPRYVTDGAGVLRMLGLQSARGLMSDAEFGIDPYDATTNNSLSGGIGNAVPGGWYPRWGKYNRTMIDGALTVGGTAAERDTYSGSYLEQAVNRTVLAGDLMWMYFHRIQTVPAADQSGRNFYRDYAAHLAGLFSSGKAIPLTATQADLLTFNRPGPVYLDWSGAWRDRVTGKVAL